MSAEPSGVCAEPRQASPASKPCRRALRTGLPSREFATLGTAYQGNFKRHSVLVLGPSVDLTRHIELLATTRWESPETPGNRCTDYTVLTGYPLSLFNCMGRTAKRHHGIMTKEVAGIVLVAYC